MNDFYPVTQSWSHKYDIVHNAQVRKSSDNEAIIDPEMFLALKKQFGSPLVGFIEGLHYQFLPRRSIPHGSVAVPEDNHDNPSAFLVQK